MPGLFDFNKGPSRRKIKIILITSFSAVFVSAVFVFLFSFFNEGKINPRAVIRPDVVKTTEAVVAGQPIKWTMLVKRSQIKNTRRLVQIPEGAENIKIQTINAKQARDVFGSQPQGILYSGKNRQSLDSASILTKIASYFSNALASLVGSVLDAIQTVIDTAGQQDIQAPEDNFIDLSSQVIDPLPEQTPVSELPVEIETPVSEQPATTTSAPAEFPEQTNATPIETPAPIENLSETTTPTDEQPALIENLDQLPETPTPQPVDITVLASDISFAQNLLDEAVAGDNPGEYSQSEKDGLQMAVDVAVAAQNNIDSSQSDIDAADDALKIAIAAFQRNGEFVKIDFQTPGPQIVEQDTAAGKMVTVSDQGETPEQLPITDVIASVKIPNIFKVGEEDRIQIKWKNNDDEDVTFQAYDKDGDGYLDYVEWTIPHLSEQIFEIIFISKAFQLDSEKNIIADIYVETRAQDGVWAQLTDRQYIRATFDTVLDNTRDNTIYARPADPNQPVTIEVYPIYTDQDGNVTEGALVATFPAIDHDGRYRVLLDNLGMPTDVFDFKIIGNVGIDWIMDAACTSAASGNWSAAATWNAPCNVAGGPTSADTVTISNGHTVTVDVAASATSVTVAGTTTNTTLSISGSNSLTVSGALSLNRPTTNNRTSLVDVGAGSLSAGSVAFLGTTGTRVSRMNISTGTVTASGNITSSGVASQIVFSNAGVLNAGGTFMSGTAGTFTASSGTVNFNAAGNQTITPFAYTFNNVTTSGSGTKSTGADTTISGNLSIGNGTTFTAAGFNLTVTGTTTVGSGASGNLTISSAAGTKIFVGLVTIANGGTWANTAANEAVTFRGGITNNGIFNAGTGVHTFDTNSQALAGTFSIPNVTVTGAAVSLTNNNTLTVSTALSGTGGLTQAATATLNIGGTSGITTLTATAGNNTVNYTGAAQTVKIAAYYNLNLSGSGAKTFAVTTINNNLSLSGTCTATTGAALAISGNLSIGNGTTFTAAGFNLTVTGTTTVGSGASGNLTISSATGTKIFVGLVTIANGGTWTNTAANEAVTFRGGITNNGIFNAGTGVHTFDTNSQALAGTFSIPNVTVTGAAVSLTNNNTLTVSTALSGTGGLTQAATATLNIGGTSGITTITASANGNTVNFNGAGSQTIPAFNYYNLNGTGGARVLASIGVIGIAGTFTPGAGAYTVTGSTISFNNSAGSQTIPVFTYNILTMGNTSGAQTAGGALSATTLNNGNLGSTLNMSTYVLTAANINNSGTIRTQNISGTPLPPGKTWGGIVNYDASSGGQYIMAGTYAALTMGNTSGTQAASGTLSVTTLNNNTDSSNILDMSTYALAATTVNNTGIIRTRNTSGTPLPSGLTWGGTVEYASSSGSQTLVTGIFNNLIQSGSSGSSLGGDVTVGGILSFVSGRITTNANTLSITAAGSISGAGSATYVFGNLQKIFNAGSGQSFNFAIGDGSNYVPVNITSANVGTGGNLKVSTTSGQHPNIGTSNIDSTKDVNRYWSFSASGGLAMSNYDSTFNFVVGDIIGGASSSIFFIGKYDSGWAYPTVGVKTSTSAQATGLSSFSDFAVGEPLDIPPDAPTLVSPANGSTINDNTPTLSAHYSDPDVGDTGTTNYRVATGSANCLAGTVVASGASAETSANSETTSWTSGSSIGNDATYYWCAQNDDGNLQSAWTSMGNFILDTTPPTVTDNVPVGWRTSITVTFICDDGSGSGCSRVYYTTDGSNPTTGSSYTNALSGWQFTQAVGGIYTLKYRGEDVVGNLENTVTAANNIQLDNAPPTNVGISLITAVSENELAVTAQTPTDSWSGLSATPYWFREIGGGAGASSSSSWQSPNIFTNTGLSPNALYAYEVRARDAVGNISAYSANMDKYTLAVVPGTPTASIDSPYQITASWPGGLNPSGTEYYIENTTNSTNSGWITSTSWASSGLACATSYNFRVRARNGDSVETVFAPTTTATTSNCPITPPTGGGGGNSYAAMTFAPPSPMGGASGGSNFAVSANNGAAVTTTKYVFLNFTAGANVKRMAISNNPSFKDAIQQPYLPRILWEVTDGAGKKIIYVKFFTEYGVSSDTVTTIIDYNPPGAAEGVYPPISESVPIEPQTVFKGGVIIPKIELERISILPLPEPIKNLALEFPQFSQTLEKAGSKSPEDIKALKVAVLTFPGLSEAAGATPNLPLSEFTDNEKGQIPVGFVFARAGAENIDLSTKVTITSSGEPVMTIKAAGNRPLYLAVRPKNPAETINGYVVFKSANPQAFIDSSLNTPASLLSAVTSKDAANKDNVIGEFTYKDDDNDGIWTAETQSPWAGGEYEIVTKINYKARSDGKKITEKQSMVMVVDPEGYVFRKIGGEQARIPNAAVSICWLNPETKEYELWPAENFRQKNPQITDVTGGYSFFVPPGEYYLKVTSKNYITYQSQPFLVAEGFAIHLNIELKSKNFFLGLFGSGADYIIIIILLSAAVIILSRSLERGKNIRNWKSLSKIIKNIKNILIKKLKL